tara:strand:+ start:4339 stop:4584 length:246 start_codon:yes stop_codon:yes gene_type:complete
LSRDIEIGDLVKSAIHVGIGIVTDIIHPEQVNDPSADKQLLDETTAEIYWVFPEPMEGADGWKNGSDYDYLAQLEVITEEK